MERSPFFRKVTALDTGIVTCASWQQATCVFCLLGMILVITAACTTPGAESESAPAEAPPTEIRQDVGENQAEQGSETSAIASETETDGAAKSPADPAPPPSDVPEEVQTEILRAIATDLNQAITAITLENIAPETWPNGCLGLNREGEFCTMALIDGWRVQVSTGDTTITYRTNQDGTLVRREP